MRPPFASLRMKRWPRMREKENLSPALWGVLTLLFLALFINYIDRGALSIAAPMIVAVSSFTDGSRSLCLCGSLMSCARKTARTLSAAP